MKKSVRKRPIIIVVILLLLVLVILPFGISIFIYEQYFGARYETSESLMLRLDDFEELERKRYEFAYDVTGNDASFGEWASKHF